MTTKPVTSPQTARRLPPLPDPPRKTDMQEYTYFEMFAESSTLGRHLDAYPLRADSTTLVSGKGYLCRRRSDLPRAPYPDLVVAFDVDAAAIVANNGYDINEVGKPPELVLEVASSSTGKRDYIEKRIIYAGMGVPEYWRFDHTKGQYHEAALAGDRLTPAGVYRPIELRTEADGVIWGYSDALALSLCWVERRLRFWDRATRRYLPDASEEQQARIAAETRADLPAHQSPWPGPARHGRQPARAGLCPAGLRADTHAPTSSAAR